MKNFYQTLHCLSQKHCDTCRLQTEEGRQWRESIARHFKVSGIDFDCPQGKAWLSERPQRPPQSRPVDNNVSDQPPPVDIPAGVLEACRNCPDQRACPNATVCCGGRVSINIIVPCPRGHWNQLSESAAMQTANK